MDGRQQVVLAFDAGEGVRILDATGVLGAEYTIVMLFRFESVSSWRRLIDFKNRSTDWGLYSYYGNLNFYSIRTGTGGAITPSSYVQVALTRNAQGSQQGYVNGLLDIEFTDTGSHSLLGEDGILSFFQDDTVVGGEHAAGAVARIRIWDAPLNELEVADLDRLPGGDSELEPVITSPLEVSFQEGEQITYTVEASNDPTWFSVNNLPSGVNFNSETREISGLGLAPGIYEIGMTAGNAFGSDAAVLRLTILPAETELSAIGFESGSLRVTEGNIELEVRLLRLGNTDGAVEFNLVTGVSNGSNASATPEQDFIPLDTALIFESGQTELTTTVQLLSDFVTEPTEEFGIFIQQISGGEVGSNGVLKVIIENAPVPQPQARIARAVVVKWDSVEGLTYRLESSLNQSDWTVVEGGIEGVGGEMLYFFEAEEFQRYFRVVLDL